MSSADPAAQSSPNAKKLAARLLSVQALYQSMHTAQSLKSVADEYLELRAGMEYEGEKMVMPDGALLKRILNGVAERRADLEHLISFHITKENKTVELLLQAILLCGAYELLAHAETDAPVIINDYLNIAHGFYESGQVAFVNGILDSVAKAVRV